MAFGFGSATKPLLGASTTTNTGTTGFGGFGNFGSTATTTSAGTSFNFGTTTSTAGSSFGFGNTTGTTGATAGTSLFGGGTSAFNLGGTGLANKTSTSSFGLGGGLGGTTTNPGLQATQQPSQAPDSLALLCTAVTSPGIYGDERDVVIGKWHQLQSMWGTGKGFCGPSGTQSVQFASNNPFCRFQSVGYNTLPSSKNKDGLVALVFNKEIKEVKNVQQQIVDQLTKFIGSKPNLTVCVDGVRSLPDNKTELIIYIQERAANGLTRRIPANEVVSAFSNAAMKPNLNQISVENVLPKIGLSGEQLKAYLDTPPQGIDPVLWEQAKKDNPDPSTLVPVPIVGFSGLKQRYEFQEKENAAHQSRLDLITEEVNALKRNQTDTNGKIEQCKRRNLELSHRVLRVFTKLESSRKRGLAIQPDEEQLRTQLAEIQSELNAPSQFKGRLNELMSAIRMQMQAENFRQEQGYQMDTMLQTEIKQHLIRQHEGLTHLANIIKTDLEDLAIIEQGLKETQKNR